MLSGWTKIGDGWEKTFPTGKGSELTVIIGPEEGGIDGLAFREKRSPEAPEEPRLGAQLQDWMDVLSPEALIEIIAKRDKQVPDLPETAS